MYPRRAGRCVGRPRARPSPLDLEGQVSIPPRPAAASQPAAAPSGSCGVASAAPSTSGSRAPVPARIASQAWRAGGGWGLGDFSLCTLLPTHAAPPLMAEEHPADAAPPTTPPAADAAPRVAAEEHPADAAPPTTPLAADAAPRVAAEEHPADAAPPTTPPAADAAPRVAAEEHPADAAPPTTPPAADAAPRVAAEEQRNAAIITNPLHDDNLLEKILLRLPGAACLSRALLVSHRWCHAISDEGFLKRFRDRHPSSPLVGGFVDINKHVPRWQTGVDNVHESNPFMVSAMRHADVLLTRLDGAWRWCPLDCRNGRLLFARAGGAMCIYDPLSERRVPIGPRTEFDDGCKCLCDCLLELDGLARHTVTVEQRGQQVQGQESFRVISLQLQSHSRCNVRAVEYNSGTLQWRLAHPQTGWTKVRWTKSLRNWKPMYAAGHIFWQTDAARLLVLDTSTMEFSEHAVPGEMVSTSWAIGELRDGKGCYVCLQHLRSSFGKDGRIVEEEPLRLEVWGLEIIVENAGATFCCKWEKDVRVSEMLSEDARVYQVHKVINGLALIGCNKVSYAIDLQSMTLLAKFESGGDAVYPYQMSWPPAVLAAATGVVANLSDEDNVQIPSKNTDGREGTSSGGSESASPRSQLQVESPDVSGSSGIEGAWHDDDNQHALASLGIGDADSTIVPAFNAVNSHANEEETGGWASDGRTMLTTIHEKVAQEVHSSQTPLNSEQHGIGEKSSQDLHGGSARIQPMEMDPCHDELTLQMAAVFPSEGSDGAILEDKSETDNLPKKATSSPMQKRHSWVVYERKKRSAWRFCRVSEVLSSNNKRKNHWGSSAHIELSANRIKCVSTPPAGGPEAHEETRPALVGAHRTSIRKRKQNKLVSGEDWVV